MTNPRPLLILGDACEADGGLSRITRDIAHVASRMPQFRVATLGRLARGSRHLPWQQYAIRTSMENQWGHQDIERVWTDFAGQERGVVLTIWDPTRCFWLARPEFSGDEQLMGFLRQGHFDLWGYVTLDATGPGNKLSQIATDTLVGYKRLLAYTKWGEGVIERTIGTDAAQARQLTWLPHGLDLSKWPLRDRDEMKARNFFPLCHEGDQLIGAIGTNQPRKDWGLVAMVCQLISQQLPRCRFWWHSDLGERTWSLNALVADFGLQNKVVVTGHMQQDQLSQCVSACDLTLHPGLGEGFGYPIFESLACGVPVLHGDYAGGADVLRQCGWEGMLVYPQAWRLDGLHNQVRPVFDPVAWCDKAAGSLGEEHDVEVLRNSVAHLNWYNLAPMWTKWLEEGL